MTADDRDPVADHLALKLWKPDPLAAVEFHERLTGVDRDHDSVWAALNPPSRMPVVEAHEP